MRTSRHGITASFVVLCSALMVAVPEVALPQAPIPQGGLASEETDTQSWSRLTPLGYMAPSLIVDPVRDRLISYGGNDDQSRKTGLVWIRSLSSLEPWTELPVEGPAPKPRMNHAAIYDPLRNRIVVYGGWPNDAVGSREVWSLELSGTPRWTDITPEEEGPGYRIGVQAAYDPIGDRMIVVGGHPADNVAFPSDVWILQLSEPVHWTKLTPSGPLPPPREDGAMIYDPVRRQMVLFGGCPGSYGLGALADVWTLSLGDSMTWQRLEPQGEPVIALHSFAATYDPVHDRMLVFSGRDSLSNTHRDLWALQLGDSPAWYRIEPPAPRPSPRYFSRAVYDVARDRMVLFGGTSDDTWVFSDDAEPQWTEVEPASGGSPYGCSGASAAHDPTHGQVLLFGGMSGYYVVHGTYYFTYFSDLWSMTLGGTPKWRRVDRDSTPSARWRPGLMVDPTGDRLILFGGHGMGLQDDDSVWQLPLAADAPWSRMPVSGPGPGARWGHSTTYDSIHNRMIVFGGRDVTGPLAETWTLSLGATPTWTRIDGGGLQPLPREGHSAVYDPAGDRMVVFGGSVGSSPADDTWQLSLSGTPTWTPIPTPVRPLARAFASSGYDGLRHRIVLVGGQGAGSGPLSDGWTFDLAGDSGWSPAAIDGQGPSPRWGAAGAFDTRHDRMLIFGGIASAMAAPFDETWIMSSSAPVYTTIGPARVQAHPGRVSLTWRVTPGEIEDAMVQRLAAFDDWVAIGSALVRSDGNIGFADEAAEPGARYGYRLRWVVGSTVRISDPTWVLVPPLRFTIIGTSPNPSPGPISVEFSLPDAAPARLEMIDIAGRSVWQQDVGGHGAGDHTISIAEAAKLRPGVYLIRLVHGGEARVSRVCLLR